MAKKKRTQNQEMDPYSFSWEDAFYIQDLDDGTLEYRKEVGENEPHWYNLKLRPNPIYPISRHFCLGCGSTYEKMLKLVSKYVSAYATPTEMYDMLKMTYSQGKCGKITLEHNDEWWKIYSREDNVTQFDDDILEAIEIGKKTKIYIGPNVKVTYTECNDELFIEGRWSEWFEEFIDRCMSFEGHTKEEFMAHLEEYVGGDIATMNEIFSGLKTFGIRSIKVMKKTNMYRWIDVLTPLVNEWSDVEEEEYDEE